METVALKFQVLLFIFSRTDRENTKISRSFNAIYSLNTKETTDRLCDLVITVPAYRTRGPGSIPGATRLGLERGPLSLVSTTEELPGRKVVAPV
jgi:hypothetical protein